jgi:NADH:ubiquinone oxidoreductase subunit 2 (subunit N)
VSFYYYVRFIRAMYIGDREADARPLSLSKPLRTALVVCAVFVILIGVYPHPFIKAAESVVTAVLPAAPLAQR